MLGVHQCIQLTVKSVTFFADAKNAPLFTSTDAGVRAITGIKGYIVNNMTDNQIVMFMAGPIAQIFILPSVFVLLGGIASAITNSKNGEHATLRHFTLGSRVCIKGYALALGLAVALKSSSPSSEVISAFFFVSFILLVLIFVAIYVEWHYREKKDSKSAFLFSNAIGICALAIVWSVMSNKGCDLRKILVSNDNEQQEIVQKFQSEFESKKKECVLLIVSSESAPDKWTIVGFNDEGGLKSVLIDNPSNELIIELKNKSGSESKILSLAKSNLACIRN